MIIRGHIGTGQDGSCTQAATSAAMDQATANELAADGVLPSAAIPFAIAQNRLESGNYTSSLFLNYNNLNGYKYDNSQFQSGQGPQSPEGDYYGAYACIEDSAQEQSAWWGRRGSAGFDLTTLTTPAAFVAELAAMQWFGSTPAQAQAAAPAYLARLNYCLTLISIQQSTGVDTTGYTGQYGQVAVLGGIFLISYIAFGK